MGVARFHPVTLILSNQFTMLTLPRALLSTSHLFSPPTVQISPQLKARPWLPGTQRTETQHLQPLPTSAPHSCFSHTAHQSLSTVALGGLCTCDSLGWNVPVPPQPSAWRRIGKAFPGSWRPCPHPRALWASVPTNEMGSNPPPL